MADSPLADYGVRGVRNSFVSTGLSGVLGVLVTFAIGAGGFWLLRRRGGTPTDGDATTPAEGATPAEGDAVASRAGTAS